MLVVGFCILMYELQGIKFYINNRFIYVSFIQCLLGANIIHFPKMLLLIGRNFLPVQSKEDHFLIETYCHFTP